MSAASVAQFAANSVNAQLSRGPVTEEGKAISSLNRLSHGLSSNFRVLPWECQADFDALLAALKEEYAAQTVVEQILVQKAAEHQWMNDRAMRLQESVMPQTLGAAPDAATLALYLRYQTAHGRAFAQCVRELRAIKNDRRHEQIGFESQKRVEASEQRHEKEEVRRQEMHVARVRSVNAKAAGTEIDNEIRQTIEAPLPGHMRVPFDVMKDVFRSAVHEMNRNMSATPRA